MFAGLGNSTSSVTLFIDGITTSHLGGWHKYYSELYLENMNLTELPAGVFDGLDRVEYLWKLSLKGNALRTLPEGLFRNLSSLILLDLQGNRLRTLPEGLFWNLSNLSELHLEDNGLRTLPEGVFQSLSRLEELDLSKNTLNTLPAGLFASQYRIREIDLSQNCLSTSPDKLFGQLRCQAFENFTCLLQT